MTQGRRVLPWMGFPSLLWPPGGPGIQGIMGRERRGPGALPRPRSRSATVASAPAITSTTPDRSRPASPTTRLETRASLRPAHLLIDGPSCSATCGSMQLCPSRGARWLAAFAGLRSRSEVPEGTTPARLCAGIGSTREGFAQCSTFDDLPHSRLAPPRDAAREGVARGKIDLRFYASPRQAD